MNLLERFEQHYTPEPNSGCWLWVASIDAKYGYGYFYVPREDGDNTKSHMQRAHVVAYRLFKGPTKGLCVCHSCDLPCCVNPDHLFLGTHQDNTDDRKKKGRGTTKCGEQHPRAVLTAEQVRAIRSDDRKTSVLADVYGLNPATVRKIKRRALWGHL